MRAEVNFAEVIVKNIEVCMEKLGLNQTKLGEKLGLSKQSVSDLMSGSRLPRVSTIIDLAQALGVTPAFLLAMPEERKLWEKPTELEFRLANIEAFIKNSAADLGEAAHPLPVVEPNKGVSAELDALRVRTKALADRLAAKKKSRSG